jgi:hypothetical protein
VTLPAKFTNGSSIPGAGKLAMYWESVPVKDGDQVHLHTSVYFADSGDSFYAPLVTNSSGVTIKPVANHQLTDEFACPCTVESGMSRVFFGYYPLWTTSTVAAFREGGYPYGSYRYWDRLATIWNATSGEVPLTLTIPPSAVVGTFSEIGVGSDDERRAMDEESKLQTGPSDGWFPDGGRLIRQDGTESGLPTPPALGAREAGSAESVAGGGSPGVEPRRPSTDEKKKTTAGMVRR